MPALDIPQSPVKPHGAPPAAPPPPGHDQPPETPFARNDGYVPGSPPRPPVSPITPVASIAQLAPTDPADRVVPPPAVDFIAQPASVPISESDNTDAIALRSAIALLQIQREKSKKDLQSLQKIKQAAVAEPEAFVEELKAGRLRPKHPKGDLLGPTLGSSLDSLAKDNDDDDDDDDDSDKDESSAASPGSGAPPPPKFGPVPEPQNIFRCPPINWAKYHVVGESLDKLHAEQQKRPSAGLPGQAGRAPVHVLAAPYSPFTDRFDKQATAATTGAQTRRMSKKPG